MEIPQTPTAALAAAVRARMAVLRVSSSALSASSGVPLTTLHRRLSDPDSAPFRWDELVAVAQVLHTSAAVLAADAEALRPAS